MRICQKTNTKNSSETEHPCQAFIESISITLKELKYKCPMISRVRNEIVDQLTETVPGPPASYGAAALSCRQ